MDVSILARLCVTFTCSSTETHINHMGVCIYYSGALHQPEMVHDLVSELTEIAKSNKWKYHLLDNPWDEPVDLKIQHKPESGNLVGNAGLKGILLLAHPECEPVNLFFDKDGNLRHVLTMTLPEEERDTFCFTKTQFAGVDIHIQLVHLLEYIGNKYMKTWELMDDCTYVENRDRAKALEVFHVISDAINAVGEAFDTIDMNEVSNPADPEFTKLIEQRIQTFLPGAEIKTIVVEEEE